MLPPSLTTTASTEPVETGIACPAGSWVTAATGRHVPLSGMSTNPARTFGSAVHANDWHALWIYFIAPSLGMLAAGELFLRVRGGAAPYCAKLHHANRERCIFHHAQHAV